jgi:hypothetical protein
MNTTGGPSREPVLGDTWSVCASGTRRFAFVVWIPDFASFCKAV